MRKNFTYCLLLLLIWACVRPVAAQTQSVGSSIIGQVRNDSEQPLPGLQVSAIHLPTGIHRSGKTGPDGAFRLDNIPVGGPYTVQASGAGFRSQLVTNMFVPAGKEVQLTFALVPDLVVVGTRRVNRTLLESSVPVDVIDVRELVQTMPQNDLGQILQYSVPSFNSTRQISADGTDYVDPASLRGLGPDQMLLLVNGKRRHTSALVNVLGSRGLGNAGYDLNTISSNAIDRVEILRDGAAAQYGSDAIAGVMNVNLKSDHKGGNVLVSNGLTSAGDGLSTLLSLNKGMKLGRKGFLNLTADADHRGYTVRRYSRNLDSWPVFSADPAEENAALAASGRSYADFTQRNGEARVNNYRALYNLGLPVGRKLRFYSFGGYNHRRAQSAMPWVLPSAQPADIVESIFPYGYQPLLNGRINDLSLTGGLTADLGGWSLDVAHVTGINRISYAVSNTLNPSLGSQSPTRFAAGGLRFQQDVTNATLSRLFPKLLAGTNLAFGAEYRLDDYRIFAGEEGSWQDYGRGNPGATGGAQGFIGYSPNSAVQGKRDNVGAFVDVEADITKHWSVDAALRYEHYSTFGSALIQKVATRWQAAKWLALRAGANTGFRAPALQQVLYRNLTLLPVNNGVVYTGLFNNRSDVARAAGIQNLQPERSRNESLGLVLTPTESFTLTADAYLIDIRDRIVLSGLFGEGLSPELDAALTRADATNAQFFTNAVNTRTYGLDLVASFHRNLWRGTFTSSLAVNFNRNQLRGVDVPAAFQPLQDDADLGNNYVDQRMLSLIETGNPRSKAILSTGYEIGKFNVLLRNVYFGQTSSYDFNFDGLKEGAYYLVFRPRLTTDLQLTYRPTKSLHLTTGANNLFNVYPNTIAEAARNGRPPVGFGSQAEFNSYFQREYGRPSYLPYDFDIFPFHAQQMSFNGAFVYLKAAYNFGL